MHSEDTELISNYALCGKILSEGSVVCSFSMNDAFGDTYDVRVLSYDGKQYWTKHKNYILKEIKTI